MKKDSLHNSIITGFIWNFSSLIINRAFDFMIKMVLARLLFPEQFGIVAMAAVFTTFVQVFTNLGFGSAIVQKKESELKEIHFHTAFWAGIVWAIIIYIVVFFIVSPLASSFYNEPILNSIIPVLSLGVLSSPINAIQKAILVRNLEFKKLAIINNAATIFSGSLALVLAYMGFGVWALVFNSVATFIVAMPLYFRFTKYIPKFMWGKEAFRDIFGFGVYTTGTKLLGNISSNIDYLIVGRVLTSTLVGAYSLSFMITAVFRSNLVSIVNQIMYPIFGKMQDDIKSLKKYYSKIVLYNCLLVFPFMGFFLIFNESFIIIFFGEKWSESIDPLFFLAIAQFFTTMTSSYSIVLRSMGKPDLEMKLQAINTILIYAPAIYIGTYFYGIIGTSISIIIIQVITFFIAQYYMKKLIEFSFQDLIKVVFKPILVISLTIFISLALKNILGLPFYLNYSFYFLLYAFCIWFFFKGEIFSVLLQLKSKSQ